MPFAEANRQRLYYEVHGEGEPMLLVMGLGTDHFGWLPQLRAWSEKYRTILFDNRDVGQSSYADGPYEIADMAADTLGLADALDLDSFHLVGMSMGGAIAQQAALAAPERIRTLTLIVSFGGYGRWGRERARTRLASLGRLSFEELTDELLQLSLSEQFFEQQPEMVAYVRQAILDNPHRQSIEAFCRQAAASSRHDVRDRLHELDLPTHVIGAECDLMGPVWKSRELAELIPGAKLTVYEGAGHALTLERTDEFARAVLDFIESASEQPAPASEGAEL
jgi:pimeloyl-ACP methyl ester carboxylesterase